MKGVFPPEWRAQSRRKRKFYATYMKWLERIGFVVVLSVLAAFVLAFNYKVDDLVTADGVKIVPLTTSIEARVPSIVLKWLVEDFETVRKGQPILEIAEGEEAVGRALVHLWTHRNSPLVRFTGPTTTVVAPVDGTIRLPAPDTIHGVIASRETLARVVNYNDLHLTASLAGQTVPKAKVGQMARVTAITFEPIAGTMFRGFGDGRPIVSGSLLGDKVEGVLEKQLTGSTLQLRDDVPLKVTSVESVQVEATVDADDTREGDGLLLDPPANFELKAQVIEGKPVATAQVALQPDQVAGEVAQTLAQATRSQTVRQFDGKVEHLKQVTNPRVVVTVKADELDASSGKSLNGAMLKRTFDATLRVVDPPQTLIEAIREADRTGKSVTCRVELRTGTRPIAFLLLKKS